MVVPISFTRSQTLGVPGLSGEHTGTFLPRFRLNWCLSESWKRLASFPWRRTSREVLTRPCTFVLTRPVSVERCHQGRTGVPYTVFWMHLWSQAPMMGWDIYD